MFEILEDGKEFKSTVLALIGSYRVLIKWHKDNEKRTSVLMTDIVGFRKFYGFFPGFYLIRPLSSSASNFSVQGSRVTV